MNDTKRRFDVFDHHHMTVINLSQVKIFITKRWRRSCHFYPQGPPGHQRRKSALNSLNAFKMEIE